MEDRHKLYSTQEAAVMIGFSDSRLRQLILADLAKPNQKIGGIWLFTIEEIERLRNRPIRRGGRPKKTQ
jgi:hypothetical protein